MKITKFIVIPKPLPKVHEYIVVTESNLHDVAKYMGDFDVKDMGYGTYRFFKPYHAYGGIRIGDYVVDKTQVLSPLKFNEYYPGIEEQS